MFKTWLKQNPLLGFLVIAFVVPWFGWTARELFPFVEWFGEGLGGIIRGVLFFFGAGVALSGFLMRYALEGREGVKNLLKKFLVWRFSSFIWIFIFLLPAVLALVSKFWIAKNTGVDLGSFEPWQIWTLFTPSLLILIAIGPLAEEAGWRGFFLPQLLKTQNALVASLVLGALWAMWHFPLSFMSDSFEEVFQNPAPWLAFFILVICWSVHFTFIFLNSKQSLLAVTLLHWTINTRNGVIENMFPETSGETWESFQGTEIFLPATVLPWILSSFLLIAFNRKQFFGKTNKP